VISDVLIGQILPLKLLEHFEITAVQNVADKNGERAMGANIPAYSTLIFTIELLEIVQ